MIAPRLDLLALYPELMDAAADTANLAVLRVRAGWEGIDARVGVVPLEGELSTARPDVVLLGSGADEDLPAVCAHLAALGDGLRDWIAAGTVLLAVGSGLDVLAESWERRPGEFVAGAAVFGGEARLLPGRASGDIVVDPASAMPDTLLGYENHSRGYRLGPDETALGVVRRGVGNGAGFEGVVAGDVAGDVADHGTAIGTHLHGPLFARNPGFADSILTRAMQTRHGIGFEGNSAEITHADTLAAKVRASLLR